MTIMDSRIDLITIGVDDLAAARAFYAETLGWTPATATTGEAVYIQAGHGFLVALTADTDPSTAARDTKAPSGPQAVMLGHLVGSSSEVVALIERVRHSGAAIITEPQDGPFGRFHAVFADPCGVRWEIAFHPGWHVDRHGQVTIEDLP